MLIVLYTKDELSFDRFQKNRDQLYRVMVTSKNDLETRTFGSTNAIHGPTFKQDIPEIKEVVRAQSSNFIVKKGNDVLKEDVLFADESFFSVFSMPLISGDPETALSDIHAIVLSEDLAEKYFGTTEAVGKTISLKIGDTFEPFVVSAVAKRCPQNSSIQFDAVLPFKFQEAKGWVDSEWVGFYMNTFVLLHEKADFRAVVQKMNRVSQSKLMAARQRDKNLHVEVDFGLMPFLDMHLQSQSGDLRNGLDHASSPIYSYILSGIAIFILLIACINFVNLTVARSLNRAKEIGVRKVVGGLRKQLIYQFLGESFLLSFVAFALAIVLTQMVLRYLMSWPTSNLRFPICSTPGW